MKAIRDSLDVKLRRLWLRRNMSSFHDDGPDRRPRLLVDVSVIVRNDAGTGIQRVVRSVWSHLKSISTDEFDVVAVHATRHRGYCFAPAEGDLNGRDRERTPVGVKEGDCFLGLDLAAHRLPTWGKQIDAWRARGAKVHVVVYDLLPRFRPEWFPPTLSERFAVWLEAIVDRSDQLLCISDDVAGDLRRMIGNRPVNERPRIGRLHLSGDLAGSAPSFGLSPAVERTLTLAKANPTILMVGTVEPRKAYDKAIAAFEHLWETADDAPSLLIIGRPGWKTAPLQERIRSHPEFGKRLYWLQAASDEALDHAYTAARAVLVASYAEGFGLPLAEAAMHRRWTLARDIAVFRDQRLPNVHYFTDDSAAALAEAIHSIARLAGESDPPQATIPCWASCVDRLIGDMGFGEDQLPPPALKMVAA